MGKGVILASEQLQVKSRFLIGLSAAALLVVIAVQYVIITETYQTKKEQFDTHYGNLVKEGMSLFDKEDYRFDFDSVLFLLDHLAVEYQYSLPDSLEHPPAKAFQEVLNEYVQPRTYIGDYIRKAGMDPEFTYQVHLNELFFLDLGFERLIYPDTLIVPQKPLNALHAGTYTHERNFFRISYDIFISFTNRSQLILREMRLILLLVVFTLLLVFSVFYITLRNMLIQKRLSEMKSDFINNMTHELKTPLSTISVASSSLGEHSIIQRKEKVEELSGLIKRQNRHLSELIDRILDINIWERDEVKLTLTEVHIEQWIRELINAFSLKPDKSSPEIDMQFQLEHETHRMDEVHMSTVINNLLSNAAKYGASPCRIGLTIHHQNDYLSIQVTDNGPGIRRDELKHIFEKFYRGEEAKRRVIKGLGLGLYYVKQIVEAHQGTITIRSAPGNGTTFNILIPVTYGSTTGRR